MNASDELDATAQLEHLTAHADAQALDDYLDSLSAAQAASAMARLGGDDQQRLLMKLVAEDAACLLERLPEVQALELLENLPPQDAAAILDELPSDQQADLIGELDHEDAEAILKELPREVADEVRAMSRYDDDVAGGLMLTEILSYPEHTTVREIIEDLGENADEYRDYDIQYAYVTDVQERLVGVLPMRDLLLARRSTPIREIMIQEPRFVRDSTPLRTLVEFFDRHHFFGVPVLDAENHLIGVVRRGAVRERVGERAETDLMRSQGLLQEELRSMPLLRRASRRLGWLSINIVLNLFAAGVVAAFQDTLQAVIALAVFLPIISDMSGCSGNQAVAVSMRELALGLIGPAHALRVWGKEVAVGIINGIALGLLVGLTAWLWQGNAWLGGVVGVALALNTIVAVSVGGCIPLLLKRMNMDPALASGPILTTVTDMCGFLLVLAIAAQLLPQLTR